MAVMTPGADRVRSWSRPRPRFALEMAIIAGLACVTTLALALHAASGHSSSHARPAAGRSGAPRPATTRWPMVAMHRVVALGDSVSAGTACGCPPFADLVARQLGARLRQPVSSTNLSVSGETSGQLVQTLRAPSTQRALAQPAVVLVTVGANDLEDQPTGNGCASLNPACYGSAVSSLSGLISQAVAQIRRSSQGPVVIVLIGYWNVFLDGAVGRGHGSSYVANSDLLTRAVNEAISAAAERGGALYLDTYALFKNDGDADDTHLLAPDGDHPNAAGQRLIATGVLTALRAVGCPC